MRFGGWGPTEQAGLRVARRQWRRGEWQKIKGYLSPPPTPRAGQVLEGPRHWGWWGQESTRSSSCGSSCGEGSLWPCVRASAGRGLTPNPDPEPWD